MGIDPFRESDVLAAFCHNGTVTTCFMNSLLGAFAHEARKDRRRLVEYNEASGPYIHDNRARIVRYFLEHTDHQWLWFLDNDMKFPEDSLDIMIAAAERYDIKILGAAYWNKYGPTPIYLSWLLFTSEYGIKACPTLPETEDPVEITACGMGCTLIHRDVLEAVVENQRRKHPGHPWDSFGADVLRFDDGKTEIMGEDVTFCLRAREVGYLTYGLPTLVAEHYKSIFMPHGSTDAPGIGAGQMTGSNVSLVPTERTDSSATV